MVLFIVQRDGEIMLAIVCGSLNVNKTIKTRRIRCFDCKNLSSRLSFLRWQFFYFVNKKVFSLIDSYHFILFMV